MYYFQMYININNILCLRESASMLLYKYDDFQKPAKTILI